MSWTSNSLGGFLDRCVGVDRCTWGHVPAWRQVSAASRTSATNQAVRDPVPAARRSRRYNKFLSNHINELPCARNIDGLEMPMLLDLFCEAPHIGVCSIWRIYVSAGDHCGTVANVVVADG